MCGLATGVLVELYMQSVETLYPEGKAKLWVVYWTLNQIQESQADAKDTVVYANLCRMPDFIRMVLS